MHNPSYFYAANTTQPQILPQLCSFYDHSVKYLDISTQKTSLHYWRIYNISASWNEEHKELPPSQNSAVTRKITITLNKAVSEKCKTSFTKLVLLSRSSSINPAFPLKNGDHFCPWLWNYISLNTQTDFEFNSQAFLHHLVTPLSRKLQLHHIPNYKII